MTCEIPWNYPLINKTLALQVHYQLWFISLSAMECVSNPCALVVTAAKLILHCIQVFVFSTVPRFTGAKTTSWGTSAQIFSGPIRLHGDNWQCRAQKLSVQCQNFGVPYQFFGVCKINGVLESLVLKCWQNPIV